MEEGREEEEGGGDGGGEGEGREGGREEGVEEGRDEGKERMKRPLLPLQVGVKSDITVNFAVPRASKTDRFGRFVINSHS